MQEYYTEDNIPQEVYTPSQEEYTGKANLTYLEELESLRESMGVIETRVADDLAFLKDAIRLKEEESLDLLHFIELTNFSASEGYYFAKELQKVHRERRELKDRLEEATRMKPFINSYKTKFSNALGTATRQIKEYDNTKKSRVYRLRHPKQTSDGETVVTYIRGGKCNDGC